MDNSISFDKKNSKKHIEVNENNESNLLTIYSFISNYVLKEDISYEEDYNRYELLESHDLEDKYLDKKVSFSEYNEKRYDYYADNKYCDIENDKENYDEQGWDEVDKEYDDDDKEEDVYSDDENYDVEIHTKRNTNDFSLKINEEDAYIDKDFVKQNLESNQSFQLKKINSIIKKNTHKTNSKNKKKNKKGEKTKKNNISSMNNNYNRNINDNYNERLKRSINNISSYFMLSMENFNDERNMFKDEKQLSRQMSYYNDAYYYTSEMIYKDNKKHKEKLALYLRLMSLFINIMIGIYLISYFPHTKSNESGIDVQNMHLMEYENLKNVIKNKLESKNNMVRNFNTFFSMGHIDVLKNNQNKQNYLDMFFKISKKYNDNKVIINRNGYTNNKNNDNANNADNNIEINRATQIEKNNTEVNKLIREMDIVNLIDNTYVMSYIYIEMNKIYKYVVYSFFGELFVISIIVFSLFILKLFIKDNNKFSVILTMYGIFYKLFCYIFAHYVLVMGLYILSIYYNIYVYRDIYEHSFNFFCYHYVYNNIHIHLLMLFYALQNIVFTINDTFNCLRMATIVIKHVIIKIYEKITCKNFITFYELEEDKLSLSLNCMNKFKCKHCLNDKCCKDKNCGEIDIDEIHQFEYAKTKLSFTDINQKQYCKNLDIKTYEQSLLNMRNPLFK
ncbi:conserved Plasmodium protein, unknown function [Plasmodium berghei]|uniref:Uncharacterized protein n=2 Tax=Plasmodium berghei TaxID=5821 RepID=A0A509AZ26_PLABA|nr:conserved Plasmodium protein, unknown function [Plasmodium berghei ANKA]CXJ11393.1 conserved Plasmodium protein, unknown function [Plasmodium berghei]SCM26016.1 conserved Plasmodium protein, unknown function [Plasmodium berghei]SCN28235.1 conserved Plasmodium protein, unknown function [Plasmodium berghei]SCO62433.1 conserved Plasmodium protein, unknown function [Plasmodium berghei]SCO63991.1 conserved Plasmodium protein, unknown function [Plasmodium berghei]|eukprot:XP_034423887.1 conserved Plasmodium protein, unknown function [Plasmodium berghei ANKA]